MGAIPTSVVGEHMASRDRLSSRPTERPDRDEVVNEPQDAEVLVRHEGGPVDLGLFGRLGALLLGRLLLDRLGVIVDQVIHNEPRGCLGALPLNPNRPRRRRSRRPPGRS